MNKQSHIGTVHSPRNSVPVAPASGYSPDSEVGAFPSRIGAAVTVDVTPDGEAGAPNLSTLPSWAANPEAQAILALIIEERPETRHYDNGCSSWAGVEYRGRNAANLRKHYMDQLGSLCAEEAILYAAGKSYDELSRQITEHMEAEQPDVLIGRLLDDAVSLIYVERIAPGRVAL